MKSYRFYPLRPAGLRGACQTDRAEYYSTQKIPMPKFIILEDANIGKISLAVDKILKMGRDVTSRGETVTTIYLTTSVKKENSYDIVEVYDDIETITDMLNKK